MKTLSERIATRLEARERARADHEAWAAALLEVAGKVEPEVAHMAHALRADLEGLGPTGVACDHCRTELVDRKPGITRSSKVVVGCPGCGWSGHMHVADRVRR